MAGGGWMDFEAVLRDAEVQAMLSEIIARGRNLRTVLKKIAAMMRGSTKETFRRQGRPVAWKGLAPLTLALRRKGKAGGKPQILRDTGLLFASIASGRGRHSVERISPTMLVLGTKREGAVDHQRGRPPRTEVWHVEAHRRRAHVRGAVKVKAHDVRAHSKTMHFGRMPKRVFLQWLPEDIRKVKRIIEEELTGGAGVLAGRV